MSLKIAQTINQIEKQLKHFSPIKIKDGFRIKFKSRKPMSLSFEIETNKIILPLREGEYIKKIHKLPLNKEYSLSYPGTASMKSMVLFIPGGSIFIGGIPTYEFAKIKIKRIEDSKLLITYNSNEHDLFFIPFKKDWRIAADKFRLLIKLPKPLDKKPLENVKYFLQIGVRDYNGKCYVSHFSEFKHIVDYFLSKFGPGHIIHFFGTNKDGFDRMFPDYSIDDSLGGKEALTDLVSYAKQKGFLTSHHYTPRIADSRWIEKNPGYKDAIVKNGDGSYIIEFYKGKPNYFMNPNNPKWFDICVETVKYLNSIGFDYIQLDQFTYQRNAYSQKPIQLGYKKMMDEFEKLGIDVWLEGVSDIQKLNGKGFYQILIRDTPMLWGDGENRRGYPYGVSYPYLFRYLFPNVPISYQIVTEKNCLKNFEKNLSIAKDINAYIYDLQMDFYSPKYMELLKKITEKIKKYDDPKNWNLPLQSREN